MLRRVSLTTFLVLVAVLLFLSSTGSYLYTDWLWFGTMGYVSVFWTQHLSRIGLGLVVGVTSAAFLALMFWLARRCVWQLDAGMLPPPFDQVFSPRRIRTVIVLAALVLGGLLGWSTSSQWLLVQRFVRQVPFNVADPVFGRDVGFYVFSLPFYLFLYQVATFLVVVSLLAGVGLFVVTGAISSSYGRLSIQPRSRVYLSLLLAGFFLLKAWGYYLNTFQLLYSPRGAVFGAAYTDLNANLPGLRILMVLALVAAVLMVANTFSRGLRLFWVGPGLLVAGSIILGGVYPAIVQQFRVSPNELARERPFISRNIAFTRQAYDLDRITEKPFPAEDTLDRAGIEANRATIDNIRLWDWRPLQQTYSQLQEIRLYYKFGDVDIDRYVVDGRLRQVMLSPRELNQDQLPAEAQTWVNQRLKYTHGYGMVMSPANEFTGEGLPVLWVKDIPPVSRPGLEVKRPEIYYGEQTRDYVIVRTTEPEFNYPLGDENVFTTYEGDGGVPVGSFANRLAFAFRLGSYRILFTGAITPESRIMINRDIRTRVRTIAPFLLYDEDPYMVLNEGRFFWIQDAYTFTDGYPYSEPYRGKLNYIRNSVKAVIDAYNGDVTFYVFDEDDPIIKTYSRVFPGLFRPAEEMPAGLRAHVRYPEFLFSVQAEMYASYHMQDPVVFYNKEDLWHIPTEIYIDREQRMDQYYLIMRLPGEDQPEFIMILPYTPARKQNMIAWLAARSDGDRYGQLLAYRFPKDKLVFGPMQVEARINQHPDISQMLTLWGQMGSQVIRGNLLVVPIEDSLLYVEPLYLQAVESKLPELKRVIVAYGGRVVMAETLEEALNRIFGAPVQAPVAPPEAVRPEVPGEEGDLMELIRQANRLYERGQERLRQGDWAGYGQAMDELADTLRALRRRAEGD